MHPFLCVCNWTKIHTLQTVTGQKYSIVHLQAVASHLPVTSIKDYDTDRWAHININLLHYFYISTKEQNLAKANSPIRLSAKALLKLSSALTISLNTLTDDNRNVRGAVRTSVRTE